MSNTLLRQDLPSEAGTRPTAAAIAAGPTHAKRLIAMNDAARVASCIARRSALPPGEVKKDGQGISPSDDHIELRERKFSIREFLRAEVPIEIEIWNCPR